MATWVARVCRERYRTDYRGLKLPTTHVELITRHTQSPPCLCRCRFDTFAPAAVSCWTVLLSHRPTDRRNRPPTRNDPMAS